MRQRREPVPLGGESSVSVVAQARAGSLTAEADDKGLAHSIWGRTSVDPGKTPKRLTDTREHYPTPPLAQGESPAPPSRRDKGPNKVRAWFLTLGEIRHAGGQGLRAHTGATQRCGRPLQSGSPVWPPHNTLPTLFGVAGAPGPDRETSGRRGVYTDSLGAGSKARSQHGGRPAQTR